MLLVDIFGELFREYKIYRQLRIFVCGNPSKKSIERISIMKIRVSYTFGPRRARFESAQSYIQVGAPRGGKAGGPRIG